MQKYWLLSCMAGILYMSYHPDEGSRTFMNAWFPNDSIPVGIQKLLKAYPDHLVGATGNEIIWKDGSRMSYDDGKPYKTYIEIDTMPDLEEQVTCIDYTCGQIGLPPKDYDPGRFRHGPFFRKMYGSTSDQVKQNLVAVSWLPSSENSKILVTTINGVSEKIKAISLELDTMKHLRPYLSNIGGTFNWRKVAGSNQLSPHSYGIAIDINVKWSHYWQWDYPDWKSDPDMEVRYRNNIPFEIVAVFEKHGFIWGGKWYHYDTMHFEYRPELFVQI